MKQAFVISWQTLKPRLKEPESLHFILFYIEIGKLIIRKRTLMKKSHMH